MEYLQHQKPRSASQWWFWALKPNENQTDHIQACQKLSSPSILTLPLSQSQICQDPMRFSRDPSRFGAYPVTPLTTTASLVSNLTVVHSKQNDSTRGQWRLVACLLFLHPIRLGQLQVEHKPDPTQLVGIPTLHCDLNVLYGTILPIPIVEFTSLQCPVKEREREGYG